jgi:hypothetical protein
MGDHVKQFYNPDDGYVYFYDKKKRSYGKICYIKSYKELPRNIQRQILAVREDAVESLELPVD